MATSKKTIPMLAGQMKSLAAIAVTTIPTKLSKSLAEKLEKNNNLANRFKKFWQDIQKEDAGESDFTSELFEKTITLSISACAEMTISEASDTAFWETIRERERNRGAVALSFDGDMWKWFKGTTIPASTAFDAAIYRFKQSMTHSQILEEGEAQGVKRVYTYTEAKSLIREAILQGEVDAVGKAVIAYFKVAGNDTLYRFDAWRGGDGSLDVNVNEVDLGSKYDSGDGVCFSN